MSQKQEKAEDSKGDVSAIFSQYKQDFSEQFKDRVRALFEHFDKDGDGHLNYEELRSLQLATSGRDMDENQYVMVCRTLDTHPRKGISLDGLRLTYASDGTNVDEDYFKVFPQKKSKAKSKTTATTPTEDDNVIEVGPGGVDISP